MVLKWDKDNKEVFNQWLDWFAWYPVYARDTYSGNSAWVWLEPCQCRAEHVPDWDGSYTRWEYTFSSFWI